MKPKKIQYQMTETTAYVEDSGFVTVYGICFKEDAPRRAGNGASAIPNISTSSELVADLVSKLTLYQVSPLHLRDVVEDYLA